MDTLITIKTSYSNGELDIAKSYLEENGIYCSIREDFYLPTPVNGGELLVEEAHAGEAIHLLIEGGFAKPEDYELNDALGEIYKKYTKLFGSSNTK